MYTIIYNFIITYLFNDLGLQAYSMEILGQTTNMAIWLSHSLTIISMILFFIFIVIFIKWLFKLVSGLIMIR